MKRTLAVAITMVLGLSACAAEASNVEDARSNFERVTVQSTADEFVDNLSIFDRRLADSVGILTEREVEEIIYGICELAGDARTGDEFARDMVEVAEGSGFTIEQMSSIAVSAMFVACEREAQRLLG